MSSQKIGFILAMIFFMSTLSGCTNNKEDERWAGYSDGICFNSPNRANQ